MAEMVIPREKLIEAGVWNPNDPRDPATNASASLALLNTMKERLAEGSYLTYCVSLKNGQFVEVFVNRDPHRYRLAQDDELYSAICKAALSLPGFLKLYPECAK
jgi:hypothetical protein